ncbi:MAG: hypothetical protein MJ171_03115 [Clostridia bacterium]|nr:hypothetical protein [Clostridia bacterium]
MTDYEKLTLLFKEAEKEPHSYVKPVYDMLKEMYLDGKLALYMSDYRFLHFDEEVSNEHQFTYNAYLKETESNRVYYLGVCIRGVPSYKIYDALPDIEKFRELTIKNRRTFYSEI